MSWSWLKIIGSIIGTILGMQSRAERKKQKQVKRAKHQLKKQIKKKNAQETKVLLLMKKLDELTKCLLVIASAFFLVAGCSPKGLHSAGPDVLYRVLKGDVIALKNADGPLLPDRRVNFNAWLLGYDVQVMFKHSKILEGDEAILIKAGTTITMKRKGRGDIVFSALHDYWLVSDNIFDTLIDLEFN